MSRPKPQPDEPLCDDIFEQEERYHLHVKYIIIYNNYTYSMVDNSEKSVNISSTSMDESSLEPTCTSNSRAQSTSSLDSDGYKQPAKKRKVHKGDDVDDETLKSIQERNAQQDEVDKQAQILDEEAHFGNQVAATLRRFTTRQKAIAKLQIDQVLVKFL